jgi:phosphoribosylanthranilate isomerase
MRVKFCGITRYDDAEHAARLGAWAVGLNHWDGSPRRCDHSVAAEIGAGLRRKLEIVGVFVDQPIDEIARAVENEHLSMVQLHGDEGLSFCHEVTRRTGCPVIKAIRVRSSADIDFARSFRVNFHLLDAYREGMPGGTGHTIDWELLRRRRSNVPLILAGGLTAENVGAAIDLTRPGAVDVASGVESAPGIKDHELMTAFAAAADEAGGPSGPPPLHEPDHFVESMEKDIAKREAEAAERAEAAAQAEAAEREAEAAMGDVATVETPASAEPRVET